MKILLFSVLLSYLGIKEPDQKIQDFLSISGLKGDYAWCASFVGYTLKESGLPYMRTSIARDYLKYGDETINPEFLDIAVFRRKGGESWQGHVGYFLGFTIDKEYVIVLGGNQSDSVNVSTYKISDLLGFRKVQLNYDK